ncbi:MAG: fumarate hydratase C-terminal domain-containing protein, partial [Planctomycetota bacterium]
MATRIDLPTSEEQIRTLEVGDEVSLFGKIVTARDMAHKFMVEQRPDWLRPLLENTIIYHCGPVMRKKGKKWQAVAAGPTTSAREEPYQGTVIEEYKVRAVIGKGGMGPKTLSA